MKEDGTENGATKAAVDGLLGRWARRSFWPTNASRILIAKLWSFLNGYLKADGW